jgi:hypothetical protein
MKTRTWLSIVVFVCVAIFSFAVGKRHFGNFQLRYRTTLSHPDSLEIVRQPPPMDFARGAMASLPAYASNKAEIPFQVDLRSFDLTALDLGDRLADLGHADFDTRTRWPVRLPEEFLPAKWMALGKDPGLGLRQLHARGLSGKGVGVGIIDQTLLVNHVEYADRLRLYEEIHDLGEEAQMHGPAVASIAVGKTTGVACDADLYYIAETHGRAARGHFDWDFAWVAKSIDRLLEVNKNLPKEHRIRVISISVGWSPQQKGFREVMAAVQRAGQEGVFVISTALEQTHGLSFQGLGRAPASDPNAVASYRPGSWWNSQFWANPKRFNTGKLLLVPMDARCVASPTGREDYVFYAEGGLSWSVPWMAGLYALACQMNPNITVEAFWGSALKTGDTVRLRQDGKEVDFGTIINPVRLIESIQSARLGPISRGQGH